MGTKKGLILAALSDMFDNGPAQKLVFERLSGRFDQPASSTVIATCPLWPVGSVQYQKTSADASRHRHQIRHAT
jgi:hypothetical protein